MKTVFKKGMKVYDRLVFPNKEGEVINVVEDDDFPIKVYYEGLEINELSYTADGRYYTDIKPSLSTKDYTIEGFEQKAPVPTFEEVIKEARSKGDYYYLPDSLEAPSEELVEATIALLKLLFLRDYYNEGWRPDWEDDSTRKDYKYILFLEKGVFVIRDVFFSSRVLTFKSREIALKFLEEQRELLEIAKPLL